MDFTSTYWAKPLSNVTSSKPAVLANAARNASFNVAPNALGSSVMNMRFKCQCQPQVNVRKIHHPRPEAPRPGLHRVGGFPDGPMALKATELDVLTGPISFLARPDKRRSRSCLPEMENLLPELPHHCERDPVFPCCHSLQQRRRNQSDSVASADDRPDRAIRPPLTRTLQLEKASSTLGHAACTWR